MNKKMKRISLIITSICIALLLASCARERIKHLSASEKRKYYKEHNLKRMPKFDIPIEINGRVVAWLEYFQGPGRKHFERYMERSGKYAPRMRAILKEKGLPEDLVYVAMIESGFNSHARSHAKATGAWQFMYRTGLHYGLKIDDWVDERRDPIKATHAAAAYLSKLYSDFGHWYLALAGYNAGEGKVKRAIKSTGTKDFWKIAQDKRALRPETRDYVPKFIAAAIIAKKPKDFGFVNINYDEPLVFDTVFVDSTADFKTIAECADASQQDILLLNPHLIRQVTPPNGMNVRIPKGRSETFKTKLAAIPKSERITIVYHKVKTNENLWKIAKKYKVKVRDIVSVNDIRSNKRIYPGQRLVIPVGSEWKNLKKKRSAETPDDMQFVKYQIKSGDTLSTIAERNNVSLSKLRKWNNLNNKSRIVAGKTLKIYKPGKTTTENGYHLVKSGDTLIGISKKHKVTTKQLMDWNNLKNPKELKAGKKIKIADKTNEKKPTSNSATYAGKSTHVLKKGETLSHVADKYNISSEKIMAWNNINDPHRVRAGQKLIIKTSGNLEQTTIDKPTIKKSSIAENTPNTDISSHKMKSGESLYSIAKKYNVSVSDLKTWNNIDNPKKLRPGKIIKIKQNESISPKKSNVNIAKPISTKQQPKPENDKYELKYEIKSGDTLWNIAKNYGVTIAQIKKWNDLKDASKLKAGDKIAIYKPKTN